MTAAGAGRDTPPVISPHPLFPHSPRRPCPVGEVYHLEFRMTATNLGYQLTCDGCGVTAERRPWVRENGTTWEPDWKSQFDIRAIAQRDGWVTTSQRRASGGWDKYECYCHSCESHLCDHVRRRRRTNPGSFVDACPECAEGWTPPYSPTAAREIAKDFISDTMAEASISALTDQLERMGAELIQLREQLGRPGGAA